jgi:Na+/H+ antiporter NhaC
MHYNKIKHYKKELYMVALILLIGLCFIACFGIKLMNKHPNEPKENVGLLISVVSTLLIVVIIVSWIDIVTVGGYSKDYLEAEVERLAITTNVQNKILTSQARFWLIMEQGIKEDELSLQEMVEKYPELINVLGEKKLKSYLTDVKNLEKCKIIYDNFLLHQILYFPLLK